MSLQFVFKLGVFSLLLSLNPVETSAHSEKPSLTNVGDEGNAVTPGLRHLKSKSDKKSKSSKRSSKRKSRNGKGSKKKSSNKSSVWSYANYVKSTERGKKGKYSKTSKSKYSHKSRMKGMKQHSTDEEYQYSESVLIFSEDSIDSPMPMLKKKSMKKSRSKLRKSKRKRSMKKKSQKLYYTGSEDYYDSSEMEFVTMSPTKSPSDSNIFERTLKPTMAPTIFQPVEEPISVCPDRLVNLISDEYASSSDAIEMVGSPQNEACLYIAAEASPNMTIRQALQKYALATFYYSLDGPYWQYRDDFFVSFQRGEPVTSIVGNTSEFGSQEWMATDNECEWSGIKCSDGLVTKLIPGVRGFNGTIPGELSLLSDSLDTIILSEVELVGMPWNLPPDIGQLSKLRVLDLNSFISSATGFTGDGVFRPIPEEIGNLSKLEYLGISDNAFEGTLPTTLGQLQSLHTLQMFVNRLTGTIPTELGMLENLVVFALDNNRFTGTIPSELGQLGKVAEFWLAGNFLTGTVPTEFGLLENLDILRIDRNKLSGVVPEEVCNLTSVSGLGMLNYYNISNITCTCESCR